MKKFSELFAALVRGFLTIVLLVGVSSCGVRGGKQVVDTVAVQQIDPARDLFERVNRYRVAKGLTVLAWNGEMARAAQIHAEAMADARRMSHDGLAQRSADLRGRGVVRRVTENVAYGGGVIEDPVLMTVDGWIGSGGHRRNLLAAEDTVTGVGFSTTADGYFYVVQLYGR